MSATLVHLNEDDLKDIKPGTELYTRAEQALRDRVANEHYVKQAQFYYRDSEEFAVDSDAAVSVADEYVWVSGWVKIYKDPEPDFGDDDAEDQPTD